LLLDQRLAASWKPFTNTFAARCSGSLFGSASPLSLREKHRLDQPPALGKIRITGSVQIAWS
jgi:hypothetical protein